MSWMLLRGKLRSELRAGNISEEKYQHLRRVCTLDMCEAAVSATYHKAGFNGFPRLQALWDWIVENWDDILKFILMVAPMFLDERD